MPTARFNPLVQTLAAPPIPEVQAWKRDYDGHLGPLIDLSQAVPGYPPHPDMLAWLGQAASSPGMAGYGDIEGEPVLRAAYAGWASALYAAEVKPANIHITSGCNQAFMATMMTVAGPGDTVLLTNPCYFNHETTLAISGVKVGYVECHAKDGFLPTPEAVEAMIGDGVRALAIVTPNNPTGATYPKGLLGALFDLCRKHGVWLIVDETYRDFLPLDTGSPHGLFSVPGWQDNLIGLYSFSKSFCIPGHRVGAVTAGEMVVTQIAKVMDNLQICAPRPPQAALAKAIPALGDWRRANTLEISARAKALTEAMRDLPEWEISALGAYFAFVRHPFVELSAHDAAHILARQAGVITIPGSFFGKGLDRYLRIAFANADVATIHQLCSRFTSCSR
ncbi:MAG: aminotransferase [Hoeflea sp.]|uniref:aminotransferase n=1 Tax=Hoeflea sp. TaxID=1940281 RepID=UPI001D7DEEC8|nr:aminotransferase [Hoeflea sp.]MBU4531963.1 aminotransferase [Alphaproteobacteria bacterium]MBU4546385.1 aminotransferase [Alphaproteobacteria bacterium]MBU4549514.1 aminotransferase [Alphaproteobacteria bacterium]MBV1722689.1 aminotransferase [Hoeflea sp.]MBV1782628.1 aminotransferase [Hoeflea sp.]